MAKCYSSMVSCNVIIMHTNTLFLPITSVVLLSRKSGGDGLKERRNSSGRQLNSIAS